MSVFIDSVEVSSFERLRQRTPLDDMPRDCWIRWYSVMRIHIFSNRLVLEVAVAKLCCMFPSWDTSYGTW
jgi:hypothetical protein